MLDSLSLWLHETPLGETLLTMLISMLPVVELRGGLPAGVAMGLPIPVAFAASLVGNMIPVPFIILFVRPLFQWVRIHIPKLEGFISHLEARAEAKSADVLRYQTWGLLIFVAIPLPGTGAWTGALIAAVLNMRLKRAVPVILLGVLMSQCLRIGLGSITVSIVTASAVLAPVASQLGASPVLVGLAICCGGIGLGLPNDSGFWNICKMSGLSTKQAFLVYPIPTLISGLVGLAVLLILNMFASSLPGLM